MLQGCWSQWCSWMMSSFHLQDLEKIKLLLCCGKHVFWKKILLHLHLIPNSEGTCSAVEQQVLETGSLDSSDWKWPQEVPRPTSCSKQGQFWSQTRLLWASSSQVLTQFEPVLFQCSYICCLLWSSQWQLGVCHAVPLDTTCSSEQMLWPLTIAVAIHWTCSSLLMSS